MIDLAAIAPNTVNVFIGPNGAGKSRLLRNMCIQAAHHGRNVIAVAPNVHDRFGGIWRAPKYEPYERGRFRFFGARLGKTAFSSILSSVLADAGTPETLDPIPIYKCITRALSYTHFEPVIGIRLKGLDLAALPAWNELGMPFSLEEVDDILSSWQNEADQNGVIKLGVNRAEPGELIRLRFGRIAAWESYLRHIRVIKRIEYVLYRDGHAIPVLEASSGEIWFIASLVFIAANIWEGTMRKKGSLIAVDEPETSLHPTWQQTYVRTLLDLFYQYEPSIVIATHSPIIISGAEYSRSDVGNSQLRVYEMRNGQATPFSYEGLSLEAMYDKLFGLITPKNHYLSQRAVSLLNSLNSGDRTLKQVVHELEELRGKSYDESQQGVIAKVEDMARQLETIRQRRGMHD